MPCERAPEGHHTHPVNLPRSHASSRQGFVMLLAGAGWGKSTAAIGYAVRASSRGLPTTIVQFLKGGGWNAAEGEALTRSGVRWLGLTQGLTWGGEDLQRLAREAWGNAVRALNSNEGGVVVLDEVTRAVDHGLLSAEGLVAAISSRNPLTSVIMTGRTAPAVLEEIADTVTRFELVKHEHELGKPFAP